MKKKRNQLSKRNSKKRNSRKKGNNTKRKILRSRSKMTKKNMRGGMDYNPDTRDYWMQSPKEVVEESRTDTPRPIIRRGNIADSVGLTDISPHQYRLMDMSNLLGEMNTISVIDELYDCPGLQRFYEEGMKIEDSKKKQAYLDNEIHKINLPRVLLINAHGIQIPSKYTLVPRGMKLYLPVGDNEPFAPISYKREVKENKHFRSYEGILLNYQVDFDLVFFDESRYPILPYSPSGIIIRELPRLYPYDMDLPAQILDDIDLSLNLFDHEIHQKCKEMINGSLVFKEDKDCSEYLNVLTRQHDREFYIEGVSDGREALKRMIERGVRTTLSDILKEIKKVRDRKPEYPSKIIGLFCRSGGIPNITLNRIKKLNKYPKELPTLTEDYFKGNIKYEGIDNLQRQKSLSSKSKFRDAWNILDKIKSKRDLLSTYLSKALMTVLDEILRRIYVNNELELTFTHITLIFQIDYFLILNPNLSPNYQLIIIIRSDDITKKVIIETNDQIKIEALKELIREKENIKLETGKKIRLIYNGIIFEDSELLAKYTTDVPGFDIDDSVNLVLDIVDI